MAHARNGYSALYTDGGSMIEVTFHLVSSRLNVIAKSKIKILKLKKIQGVHFSNVVYQDTEVVTLCILLILRLLHIGASTITLIDIVTNISLKLC